MVASSGLPLQTVGKTARALAAAAALGAAAYSGGAAVAETAPTPEILQARCIQEAMLRGLSGDALKEYFDSCMKARGAIPMPDQQPSPSETPAC
jgi:hypothetical protein